MAETGVPPVDPARGDRLQEHAFRRRMRLRRQPQPNQCKQATINGNQSGSEGPSVDAASYRTWRGTAVEHMAGSDQGRMEYLRTA